MKFIRLTKVMAMTGLARSTVYKLISEQKFPPNVSLGGKSVAWVEAEIFDWMESKIAERDEQQEVSA